MPQRLNLREQVMNELGRAIARGTLSPGDTLPRETDLSDAYGVSRTVMREAIKGLAARGLVRFAHAGGDDGVPAAPVEAVGRGRVQIDRGRRLRKRNLLQCDRAQQLHLMVSP